MTKKHFEALARNIARTEDEWARKLAAIAVATTCREFNPAFDAEKFFKACNVSL